MVRADRAASRVPGRLSSGGTYTEATEKGGKPQTETSAPTHSTKAGTVEAGGRVRARWVITARRRMRATPPPSRPGRLRNTTSYPAFRISTRLGSLSTQTSCRAQMSTACASKALKSCTRRAVHRWFMFHDMNRRDGRAEAGGEGPG